MRGFEIKRRFCGAPNESKFSPWGEMFTRQKMDPHLPVPLERAQDIHKLGSVGGSDLAALLQDGGELSIGHVPHMQLQEAGAEGTRQWPSAFPQRCEHRPGRSSQVQTCSNSLQLTASPKEFQNVHTCAW